MREFFVDSRGGIKNMSFRGVRVHCGMLLTLGVLLLLPLLSTRAMGPVSEDVIGDSSVTTALSTGQAFDEQAVQGAEPVDDSAVTAGGEDMCECIECIFFSSALQIVIVAISILIFLYVRLAIGPVGRYLIHLAFSWGVVGVTYGVRCFICFCSAFMHIPLGDTGTVLSQVIDSTLSLVSSALLVTAWYMMRDVRIEMRTQPRDPRPTMSKSFLSGVILLWTMLISTYISLVFLIIQNPHLTIVLVLIDVVISAIALVLVGWEFALMPYRPDESGTLFVSHWFHLAFRIVTFLVYLLMAILQIGYIVSILAAGPLNQVLGEAVRKSFQYPGGPFYYFLAVLKLLCAATGAILVMHAFPSVRWRHRYPSKLRSSLDDNSI